eukprot:Plantae.Rhodophyta-Rhodochaete_pulchella.ctg68.p1 GENE.Plantae.Rhodophyta-Rhodochaete_pulchella.ctg68~~Plantae.Rhodophyta-Rhodochaete_pulchella.ctg68.p1  ORF type:complete len:642 (+),score=111.38 Plantae.Rhodophyta-Rhodochaete_pulchella.ctg68:100-1926(+)
MMPPEYRKICFSLPQDTNIVVEGKRHTKIVATIGPSTETETDILRLAAEGVNLVRLNMSHGDYDWHRNILSIVRKINIDSPFVLGTMIDIGSLDMVRLGEFSAGLELTKGGHLTLTTRHEPEYPPFTTEVSYDGFLDVVAVGDLVQIATETGGAAEVVVKEIDGHDVVCEVTLPGKVRSRASIAIRGKSYQLLGSKADDTPCEMDSGCHPLDDIEFALSEGVDYVSLSFVENAEPILELKRLLLEKNMSVGIVAKIESANALGHLEEIVREADAVMVARGDLGTAIPYEKVPVWQERIVKLCRQKGKPSLVSTHFLESMVVYPTPTRAEATDITEAVRQRTDGLVLTSETASGKHPFKAIGTMNAIALRIEEQADRKNKMPPNPPLFASRAPDERWATSATKIAENIAASAALLANRLRPRAILVFTQKGLMASLLSRARPRAPVFAFTAKPRVRSRLSVLYGVRPFRVTFDDDPEVTITSAFSELKTRQLVQHGDQVLVVADVLGGSHGARREDIRRVFDDISSTYGTTDAMPRSLLRPALRRLGLKASDAVETAMGMTETDYVMSEAEGGLPDEARVESKITFDRFQAFIDDAVEIVHTIQLRTVD